MPLIEQNSLPMKPLTSMSSAMFSVRQRIVQHFLFLLLGFTSLAPALTQAQTCASDNDCTRTSNFGYQTNGLLNVERVEPGNLALCVQTTYTYDAYGNKNQATTANCASAPAAALFDSRIDKTGFSAGSSGYGSYIAGIFPSTGTNALNHTETREFHPLYGQVAKLTGPNALVTNWEYDALGRKTVEKRPDTTQTRWRYVICNNSATYSDPGAGQILEACDSNYTYMSKTGDTAAQQTAKALALTPVHYIEVADYASNGTTQIGPKKKSFFDLQGREIRTETEAWDGTTGAATPNILVKFTVYDGRGQMQAMSLPFYKAAGVTAELVTYEYDTLNRLVAERKPDPLCANGAVSGAPAGCLSTPGYIRSTIAYEGLKTTTINVQGQREVREKNSIGQLVRATDHYGATVVYQYDAHANLILTRDALGNEIKQSFDIRGRKIAMQDPDLSGPDAARKWVYEYDALGQLKVQKDARFAAGEFGTAPTTMVYDKLGRMKERSEAGLVTNWFYDTYEGAIACAKGLGKLCEVKTDNGYRKKMEFDAYGRPIKTTVTQNSEVFVTQTAYDATTGRVANVTYPSGFKVTYGFTPRGLLRELKNAATGAVYWNLPTDANPYNVWGQLTKQNYGNGFTTVHTYEPKTGRLSNINANKGSTSAVSLSYEYTALNNIWMRTDGHGAGAGQLLTESFTYDSLNRVTQARIATSAALNRSTVDMTYNAIGNLLTKTDAAGYVYNASGAGSTRPHALASTSRGDVYSYDANGNLKTVTGRRTQSVDWTAWDMPAVITETTGGVTKRYSWAYGADHQRVLEIYQSPAGTRTTVYLHPDNVGGLFYERTTAENGAIENKHYLSAGGGVIGIVSSAGVHTAAAAATPTQVRYWHKDHQGSTSAITDEAGNVVSRMVYDTYGKRRQPNGSLDVTNSLVVNNPDRGYTGHEHLDELGLIHMNGRIYDPLLGRFLSADPYIQAPNNLQSYNRYSYVFNNPLKYTDPSGYRAKVDWGRVAASIVVAIIVQNWAGAAMEAGAVAEAGTAAQASAAAGGSGVGIAQTGTAVGMVQNGVTLVSGLTTTGTAVAGMAGGFAGSYVASDGDLNEAAKGALTGAAFGSLHFMQAGATKWAAHGAVGGVSSMMNGGKFWRGFISQAFSEASGDVLPNLNSEKTIGGAIAEGTKRIMIGGTVSYLSGGKFGNGAATAAMGYLINNCGNGECIPGSDSSIIGMQGNTAGYTGTINDGDRAVLEWTATLATLPIGVGGTIGPRITAAFYEKMGGTALVRYTGALGESAVGWIGEKTRVVINGNIRIIDGVTFSTANEVKNVVKQGLTAQIKDTIAFAQATGREAVLWVNKNTVLSQPLQRAIQEGQITLKRF
jgi:RHS repeat-associated protein